MCGVGDCHMGPVAEHLSRFVETNVVVPLIGSGLGVIPFKGSSHT